MLLDACLATSIHDASLYRSWNPRPPYMVHIEYLRYHQDMISLLYDLTQGRRMLRHTISPTLNKRGGGGVCRRPKTGRNKKRPIYKVKAMLVNRGTKRSIFKFQGTDEKANSG